MSVVGMSMRASSSARNLAQAELAQQVAVGLPQPTWNAGPQENAAMRAKHALPVGDLA
jgi:hypothetical protein